MFTRTPQAHRLKSEDLDTYGPITLTMTQTLHVYPEFADPLKGRGAHLVSRVSFCNQASSACASGRITGIRSCSLHNHSSHATWIAPKLHKDHGCGVIKGLQGWAQTAKKILFSMAYHCRLLEESVVRIVYEYSQLPSASCHESYKPAIFITRSPSKWM